MSVQPQPTYVKDPDAVLDYTWDWSEWLGTSDAIAAFDVIAPAGITLGTGAQAPTEGAGVVTAWLSGGTLGARYEVVCHIESATGRKDDRTIVIKIANR